MKKLLSTLFFMLVPVLANAYDAQIDGIYYNFNTESKTAEVTYRDYDENMSSNKGAYFGEVIIPGEVIYNDEQFRVTSIGNFAFRFCYQLTSVTIPDGVTTIGEKVFEYCEGLTSITIPNSVTSIGDGVFHYCSGLTSVTIPNSVTSIGKSVFSGCSGLTSVTIPNSVTSIGDFAFENCRGLTSITIPNSVTSIDYLAFRDCSGLTSVHISDLEAWCKIVFDGKNSNPLNFAHHLFLNDEEIKDLVIPNSVTTIGSFAFYGCSGLTSVTIPNSVTSIGYNSFNGCSGLTSVTIPNSVISIRGYAFQNCSGLTSVTIPNSVTTIGERAFWECTGLTTITFPQSVNSIGGEAFYDCNAIRIVKSYITEPFSVNSFFSKETYRQGTLYIPAGTEKLYTRFDGWKEFLKIVEMEGEDDPVYLTIIEGESERIKLLVKQGENYTWNLNRSDGCKYQKVYFNDNDVTSQIDADNNYTTPNISSSSTLKVVYDNNYPTGDLNHDKVVNAADVVKLTDIIMNQ